MRVSPIRRLFEAALDALMPNDWPARLAVALGADTTVDATRHEVRVPARLGAASRLRVAFASDLHCGPTTPQATLEAAFGAIRAARPDLLLLGGDFVSVRAGDARRIGRLVEGIEAPAGQFAVLGNHDHYAGAGRVHAELEAAGVRVLVNAHARLPPPFDGVSLCGIDDHCAGAPNAAAAFRGAAGLRLLLMHEPSGLLDLDGQDFDLALCGHTHGGQVALPGPVPLFAGHGRLSRRYLAGRFRIDERRTLLVSRGVGCTILPLRINAPAEVMICDVAGSDGADAGADGEVASG